MSDLYFNSKYPIIIIDNSYYIFYRYFATISWFRRQENEIDHINIMTNKEFIIAFFKHFEADIKKLIKKFKTIRDNIIFCIDCPRLDIWRNTIYEKYKQSRVKKDNFNSNIFSLFEDYLNNNNFKNCKFDNLEADDIAYLLQYKLLTLINTQHKIFIITNDNDYLQMYSNNVNIYNMQLMDLSLKIKYNPIVELNYKIIMGDKSDNISKIQNGMKKNIAEKIALMDNQERNDYLIKNNIMDAFKLNKTLIDFREIPKTIIKNFYEFYNISIN